MGLALGSAAKGVGGRGFGPLQFSKCPVSSVKEILVVCAAQMVRVCSDEVEYIGWKSYGMLLQLVPVGSNWTWPNPLAALAVMDPVSPLHWSLMTACRPFGVSCSDTFRLSPDPMNRSFLRSGVNVAVVESTGFAGAVGRPFLVRNAKLTYSRPVLAAHVGFSTCPVTAFSARLKMFIAAHHLVGSQLLAPTATGRALRARAEVRSRRAARGALPAINKVPGDATSRASLIAALRLEQVGGWARPSSPVWRRAAGSLAPDRRPAAASAVPALVRPGA